MKTVGKTEDAGWEIGVSRTVPHAVDEVWRALLANEAAWLGAGATVPQQKGEQWRDSDGAGGELRGFRDLDRIRVTHRASGASYETTVQVTVRATGGGATVRFHQERMRDGDERERQRAHWTEVMDRLAVGLGTR